MWYQVKCAGLSASRNIYIYICGHRCRAISVEAGMGSLDSENFRAPGKHLKACGLPESAHASLSAVGALALQEPGYFLDAFSPLT